VAGLVSSDEPARRHRFKSAGECHGPERTIRTGIGPVPVRRVKIRDRADAASEEAGELLTFTSAILPRWARRTRSLDALLPVLYLRGISTGDFQEALAALLGREAPNLSPSVIGRLKEDWQADYECWQRRDLAARRYVYIWAGGVYLQARMEDDAACMLVVIGATPEGRKELVGFQVGVRESARDAGANCSSTSRRAASPSRPSWRWATAPWGSGRRSRRSSPRLAISAAGSTSSSMC
jgi:hypothetical protein